MDRFRYEPDESLLDQVEPGRAGRDEVEVDVRPPLQPGLDIRPFVSPTVVENQVQLEIGGILVLEQVQEPDELSVPTVIVRLAGHISLQQAEGGKERSRLSTPVVVSRG